MAASLKALANVKEAGRDQPAQAPVVVKASAQAQAAVHSEPVKIPTVAELTAEAKLLIKNAAMPVLLAQGIKAPANDDKEKQEVAEDRFIRQATHISDDKGVGSTVDILKARVVAEEPLKKEGHETTGADIAEATTANRALLLPNHKVPGLVREAPAFA